MKAARNYINTLYRCVKAFDYWLNNGNGIIKDMGSDRFLKVIESDTTSLSELDANEVLDEILEHEDGIDFRLKRVNEYGLLDLLEYIDNNIETKASLTDDAVNEALNRFYASISEKANDLCRIIAKAESFVKPKNPIIEKGLTDRLLCSYFYDNKKVLEEYLNFCLSADNIKLKAIRAKELADKGKIKNDYVRKPLHKALKKIGLNVGSYPQWNASINLV